MYRSLQQKRLKVSNALYELEIFLKPRIEAAKNGRLSFKSIDEIFDETLKKESKDDDTDRQSDY